MTMSRVKVSMVVLSLASFLKRYEQASYLGRRLPIDVIIALIVFAKRVTARRGLSWAHLSEDADIYIREAEAGFGKKPEGKSGNGDI